MARYADRNRLLERMGFKAYADYLASDLWQHIRSRVMKRDNRTCRICRGKATGVHHHDYNAATLKGERIDGLYALCRPCHQKIEFKKDGSKYKLSEVQANLIRLLGLVPQKPVRKPKKKRPKNLGKIAINGHSCSVIKRQQEPKHKPVANPRPAKPRIDRNPQLAHSPLMIQDKTQAAPNPLGRFIRKSACQDGAR